MVSKKPHGASAASRLPVCLKRGSEPYLDVLPDIAVCGEVINAEAEPLREMIDAIEDAMPDDD